MKCLDETTLMELSLPGVREPSRAELEHLGVCQACATELGEQKRLSSCLTQLADPEPDTNFMTATCCRFVAEQQKRRSRRLAGFIAAGLGTGLLVVPVLLWAMVTNAGSLAIGAGELLKNALVLGQVAAVFLRLPLVPSAVAAASAAAAVIVAALIAQLARTSVRVSAVAK